MQQHPPLELLLAILLLAIGTLGAASGSAAVCSAARGFPADNCCFAHAATWIISWSRSIEYFGIVTSARHLCERWRTRHLRHGGGNSEGFLQWSNKLPQPLRHRPTTTCANHCKPFGRSTGTANPHRFPHRDPHECAPTQRTAHRFETVRCGQAHCGGDEPRNELSECRSRLPDVELTVEVVLLVESAEIGCCRIS